MRFCRNCGGYTCRLQAPGLPLGKAPFLSLGPLPELPRPAQIGILRLACPSRGPVEWWALRGWGLGKGSQSQNVNGSSKGGGAELLIPRGWGRELLIPRAPGRGRLRPIRPSGMTSHAVAERTPIARSRVARHGVLQLLAAFGPPLLRGGG
jgi:hypothetical protein